VAVTDDGIDASQSAHLSRSTLGVAARHHHAGCGIISLHTAEVSTRGPFRLCGDCAGIQHNHGCMPRRHSASSGARKLRRERIAVGLTGPATEVFYVIFFHVP